MKELEDCLREALEESPYGIVTNDTALETARKYASELLRQRDELKRMLNSLILSICAHPDYVSGEEGDEWHDLTSLAEASIKSTESI